MSEGEHTIISKIPRERLNQIAARKLTSLAVPVRLAADRETLEGELLFQGSVLHPATGAAIARARFSVEGHDRLRFTDPPLSALGPVPFYDAERLAALEQRVLDELGRRAALLQDLAARLRALRLEPGLDPDRLAVRAVVKTPGHAFEVFAGPDGLQVTRVAPVGGRPFDVPPSFRRLELARFEGPGELEAELSRAAPELEQLAAERPEPGAPAAAAGVEATPPPRNALTLAALAERFGGDAMLAPNAEVEILREFESGGTRYRFVATREVGTTFRGRVIGPSGDLWSERFELAAFAGPRQAVAAALGEEGAPARGVAAASGRAAPEPRAGEVWVMNVVVEAQGPDEVRYVGTDIDGRPYGAARVLKRPEFEAVFSHERGGWRLLVLVDQVHEGAVTYRQLDRLRQPIGAPRRMASSILMANFVPEAATA
ncbi:hypothetical protein [Anaeromyxobacter paludicola]|uniref:DUF4388 domain-containing protein n=1 Tax=Anaeromyxobacter paludicola TaxID=2918171 RepID=A0ABM7X703_9BACT|nr:hypothetical protein [Anaeromyxobacter paludicola]BDG07582.1 hypothetical protein AMPC_06950 [Anaeromyxobacter paludicola]